MEGWRKEMKREEGGKKTKHGENEAKTVFFSLLHLNPSSRQMMTCRGSVLRFSRGSGCRQQRREREEQLLQLLHPRQQTRRRSAANRCDCSRRLSGIQTGVLWRNIASNKNQQLRSELVKINWVFMIEGDKKNASSQEEIA